MSVLRRESILKEQPHRPAFVMRSRCSSKSKTNRKFAVRANIKLVGSKTYRCRSWNYGVRDGIHSPRGKTMFHDLGSR